MKKRILALVAASMMLLTMLAGCGSSGDTSANNSADNTKDTGSAQTAQQETPKEDAAPASEGDLGDYHVKILDAETGLKDYDGNPVIGVKPANEYMFRIFTTPVGPYFKGGVKPLTIRISDFDRAAPHGTGHIKAGLNYAMSLHAIVDAHKQGFAENLYLDPATRTYVEETGGANFLFITKDGKFVTPKSDSILPSITRRSLMVVAEKYLHMPVEHRQVKFSEVPDFAECGLCGTAAVISPIGKIVDHGKEICFPSGMEEMGPYTKKLRETLTGIQMGEIEGPEGWVHKIM